MFYRFYRCFLPPAEIPAGMAHLAAVISSPAFARGLHPVIQAFYVFSTLVYFIHPFEDGNGRVARLLGNILLRRHGFPWVIHANDKILSITSLMSKITEQDF